MKQISIREVRAVLAGLDEVLAREGELIITRNGKAMARSSLLLIAAWTQADITRQRQSDGTAASAEGCRPHAIASRSAAEYAAGVCWERGVHSSGSR